jgi:hypothetical protein
MRIRAVSLALPLLLLAACADAPPGPGDGNEGIPHATGPGALLVRVDVGGGFVPVEWHLRNLPTVSLYGDGTLITPGAQIAIYPGPALPAISRRTVEEDGVQAILREAIDATDSLPADLGDMGTVAIADAPTTVITVRAGTVDRRIEVYALAELGGRPDGMPEDVYRARQRLAGLVTKLTALDGWLPAGSLGSETTFEGDAARLFVGRYRRVEDLAQEPIAWPLGGGLGSFGTGTAQGYRCGTVLGDDWRTLLEAAGPSNELTPWMDGGERYSILFRPLLPDEAGCPGDA